MYCTGKKKTVYGDFQEMLIPVQVNVYGYTLKLCLTKWLFTRGSCVCINSVDDDHIVVKRGGIISLGNVLDECIVGGSSWSKLFGWVASWLWLWLLIVVLEG